MSPTKGQFLLAGIMLFSVPGVVMGAIFAWWLL